MYIRVHFLKRVFAHAKTSLLHGTTAILGSSGRTISVMLRGVKKVPDAFPLRKDYDDKIFNRIAGTRHRCIYS